MKLSINSRMWGSSPRWLPSYPLEEVVKRVSSIGYDGIEIGAASPHAWPDYLTADQRRNVKKILQDIGLLVSSICPALGGAPGFNPASPIEKERRASVDYYKKCIDLAVDWASQILIWIGGWSVYGVPKREAWKWSKECLFECAEYANERGVIVAIEPTPADSDIIESLEDALVLMEKINLPNVKIMFDTIHVVYRREVMADYVRQAGNNLIHVHVSDYDRLPPGLGKIDFRTLIKALKEISYEGFLAQEIGFSRDIDPDMYALAGFEYLKRLIEE